MQLVLAALSVLLGRTQAYLAGPLSATMASTVQQLAAAGQQQALQPASAVSVQCVRCWRAAVSAWVDSHTACSPPVQAPAALVQFAGT
jgi:hypothetical protein